MRVVIDSSMMQSDKLRTFLSQSAENFAVITDYAAMEAFKGDTLVSIQASWCVLRDFTEQIIVLSGTREAALVDVRAAGIADRMVSKSETAAIPDFVQLLDLASADNRGVQEQLLRRGKWADDHMKSMLARADGMDFSIAEFSAAFTKAELQQMRKCEHGKFITSTKFLDLVDRLTVDSFNAPPDRPQLPSDKHWRNHFLYRHTFTYLVYMMQLVAKGGVTRRAELVRNDAADVIFATYASYFNGLMTDDRLASVVYRIARDGLKAIGARMPEEYVWRDG